MIVIFCIPLYNPSPVVAHDFWTYQFLSLFKSQSQFEWSPNFSVISTGFMALFKSCLFAKIRSGAFLSPGLLLATGWTSYFRTCILGVTFNTLPLHREGKGWSSNVQRHSDGFATYNLVLAANLQWQEFSNFVAIECLQRI